jgi:fermentation-respiration switch protein FrsA (DUF1100 family)
MPVRLRHLVAVVFFAGATAGGQSPAPPPAPAADRFAGDWAGVLRPGAASLRITLTITRDAAGGYVGTAGSPDQGPTRIPATVAVRGDTLTFAIPTAGARFVGVLSAGDSVRGTFTQGPGTLPLALGRAAPGVPAPAARRPQTPAAPFPYRTQDVTFESVPGVRLAGTLVVPPGPGPFPAVVFITGSGPQNRDEELFEHRPFAVIADRLARAGVASLRADDRGVGASTGDFRAATSADFAADAEAAVRYLRTRPEVARDRVGLLGHSEGGLIAPMVAARTRDVAFLVLLAGPGLPGDSILLLQGAALARAAGLPDAAVAQQASVQRPLFAAVRAARDSADASTRIRRAVDSIVTAQPEAARAGARAQLATASEQLATPWMRYFLTHDPAPVLRRVQVPVLALNGALDRQVPAAENLGAIRAALAAGRNRDHTETTLAGLNHLFQTAGTGLPNEYGVIEETVAPAALDAVTAWIVARFARARR